MKIALSSAHSKTIRGAKGFIDEVDESRRVVTRVAEYLRSLGVEVVTFHDDISRAVMANLRAINNWHAKQRCNRNVSVHFNAHVKTDNPRGTEVLHLSQLALASKISKAIADASGLINRGAKQRKNLSFLNNNRTAILVEVCFVDSRADVDLYQANFDQICKAIAENLKD